MSRAIYVEEDDGSVAAFSISSPSQPATSNQTAPPLGQPDNFLTDFTMSPRPLGGTPTSIATSASSFARKTNGLESLQALAATITTDPGVHGETAPPTGGAATDGAHPKLVNRHAR